MFLADFSRLLFVLHIYGMSVPYPYIRSLPTLSYEPYVVYVHVAKMETSSNFVWKPSGPSAALTLLGCHSLDGARDWVLKSVRRSLGFSTCI